MHLSADSRHAGIAAHRLASRAFTSLTLLLLALAAPLDAQQPDSLRRPTDRARAALAADTVSGPPISPKRAFLYSLALPGLGQARLNRGTAGAVFFFVEALSVTMWLKSVAELDFARRNADFVVTDFERRCPAPNPAGLPCVLLATDGEGNPIPIEAANRYAGGRVVARRQHVEDWVAILLANHLLSGADAYVGAHLWDLPGRVAVSRHQGRILVGASFTW